MRGTFLKRFLILSIISITAISATTLIGCKSKDLALKTFNEYKDNWKKKDYKAMYALLDDKSKEYISEKDFVDKYTKIYDSIDADKIELKDVDVKNVKDNKEGNAKGKISLSMDSTLGKIDIEGYEINLIESKDKKSWQVEWNEKLIFPQLEKGEKIKFQRDKAVRGELKDRNGVNLAVNGKVATVGIHPKKFGDNQQGIADIAKILDINSKVIQDKLAAAKDKPDELVTLVDVSLNEQAKLDELIKIPGVKYVYKPSRVYNGGEAIGALVGYVAPITAEELEKNKGKGYGTSSLIGKTGLEYVFETRLKGEDGGKIFTTRKVEGKEKEIVIVDKKSKKGEDIKLTVDLELQKKIYSEMAGQKGSATAINPKDGHTLALVSSPSYDPNIFTTYKTDTIKSKWDTAWNDISVNRFNKASSPGSTFKLVTAAIGLENGIIKPEEQLDIKGTDWKKDSSWGGQTVTRMVNSDKPIDLKNAFINSDNIYFAMQTLKIGKDKFIEGSKKFGIGEEMPYQYPMAKTQIANNNTIGSEMLLADTGYGQGEVLVTPIQMVLAYSSVVNNGSIMEPVLEISDNVKTKVWKENIISKDNVNILKEDLLAVVNSETATAGLAKINGMSIAGKTGTAELKKNREDKNPVENAWFIGMNTENPSIVIGMMMEDAKSIGGTKFVVPKAKNCLEYYLKK
ncbi:penicillin-binding protein [Clostridium cavendishii DSM 21758]|uniref:Penicillin-binding protein n=1 Tax=Clostridium cavendishii DSM 21758 TaxID=1121302 RepID=A0A1M6QTT8_9CLOT|nr:penicillin-binding transpeptidase domain-containing protein [Clostridium cavendishii]SHK23729.1 penicillin-binding protein [Clostridium cavendishii DSM 21758]